MAIVYMATNIINGSRYVGMTSKTLRQRRNAHHSKANGYKKEEGNSIFYPAIRKYGRDSFIWEILAEFNTHEDALKGEMEFISKLKPEYNIRSGGQGGTYGIPSSNRKKVVCLEDGILFPSGYAASLYYGICNSELAKSCGMNGASVKGKHFMYSDVIPNEIERQRIIKKMKDAQVNGRRRSVNILKNEKVNNSKYASRSRSVVCLDDGLEFQSASEAGRHYKSAKSAIIEMCLGKNGRKSVNGKRFQYRIMEIA